MGSEEVPDEDPVAAIYHRALPHVYGYLLSRCGDVSLAEDLAAETFMAAVAAVREPGRPEAPSITTGWLVGVARHKLADHGGAGERAPAAAHGRPPPPPPTVRYFVGDLDAAIEFYCQRLGFEEELRSAPAFAMLYGGGLRLLLSVPGLPGAGRALPDGTVPAAGGSNRITLQVTDVTAAVAELRTAGVRIRADVSAGVAVRQALIEDPAGNLVELFEPAAGYHERPSPP